MRVTVSGRAEHSARSREEYLVKLPDASRGAATTLYAQYDAVEGIRRVAEKELVKEAHRHPMRPGPRVVPRWPAAPIRVAQLMPIVVSRAGSAPSASSSGRTAAWAS